MHRSTYFCHQLEEFLLSQFQHRALCRTGLLETSKHPPSYSRVSCQNMPIDGPSRIVHSSAGRFSCAAAESQPWGRMRQREKWGGPQRSIIVALDVSSMPIQFKLKKERDIQSADIAYLCYRSRRVISFVVNDYSRRKFLRLLAIRTQRVCFVNRS